MKFKSTLIKFHWLSRQFGLDPLRLLRSLRGLPAYWRDHRQFRKGYQGRINLMPCLHDRYAEGGTTKSEYFWQDLLVARWIHEAKPVRHVDIGSRVDGFVAHVASFREIEVFDVRPLPTRLPGITFRQAELMNSASLPSDCGERGYCDSLSCLHALEHFGLGRYGDPIDPRGYKRGLANLAGLLESAGTLYLSTPIGKERVEFNAHRVFDPRTIIRCMESSGLCLAKLTVIGPGGEVRQVQTSEEELMELAEKRYNLGVFVFIKKGNEEDSNVKPEYQRT